MSVRKGVQKHPKSHSQSIPLSQPQIDFLQSDAVFPAFVAGYGAGKTHAAIARIILKMQENPGSDAAYYLPTYDLVNMTVKAKVPEMLTEWGIPFKVRSTPTPAVTIDGLGTIHMRSVDRPERVVGYEVAHSVVDELDTLPIKKAEVIWRMIVARNRQPIKKGLNTVAVATTPDHGTGGFMYDRWVLNKTKQFELIQASTHSNPRMSKQYINNIISSTPKHRHGAYIHGKIECVNHDIVYVEYDPLQNGSGERVEDDDHLRIGMDFNITQCTAVVMVERGGQFHCVDEITDGYNTDDLCRKILTRYSHHLEPRRVISDITGKPVALGGMTVYPDAAGRQRKTSSETTDIHIIQSHGLNADVNSRNPGILDRVNTVNAAFCNGRGERTLFVNQERCPTLHRGLVSQGYKHMLPDKDSGLDHVLDSLGYACMKVLPVEKPMTGFHVCWPI